MPYHTTDGFFLSISYFAKNSNIFLFSLHHSGDTVAQSVERMTPGEEIVGLIPDVAARSPLVESVSV